MRRPGTEPPQTRNKILQGARLKDLELRDRSSRSLLANVLDLDDDIRGLSRSNSSHLLKYKVDNNVRTNSPTHALLSNHQNGSASGVTLAGEKETHFTHLVSPNRQLAEILRELKVLTEKVRKEEQISEDCNDWKFAAMVIDRLCLWVFTIFTAASTCAILFSAPHIFD